MSKKENLELMKEREVKNMEKAVQHHKMSQKVKIYLNLNFKIIFRNFLCYTL